MSLRFVFGRSGHGKSTYCFNEIKKGIEKKEGNRFILLVPEYLTFSSENTLLHTVSRDEDFRGEVLSFRTLGNRIFTEVGGLSHRHINSSGRSMLIFNILSSLSDSLKVFSKSSAKMGFIPDISNILKEFKRFDIESSEIEDVASSINSETLKGKLQDISKILDEFNERLHGGYVDEEDEIQLLARKIPESSYLSGAEVFVDGFEGMNPIQLKVLEEIIKKAKRVTVTITSDGLSRSSTNWDLFTSGKDFEENLLRIAANNGVSYEKPINLNDANYANRFSDSTELAHLEKYAFKFPFVRYKDETKDIEVFTASNLYSEVKSAAKSIVKMVRENGYRYRDIVVATRNMDRYESLIDGIFSDYNIPLYIDKKKVATENPIVVLLLSALEVQRRRWSYEGVFTYLKSGLIDIDGEDINLLENYVVENGIKGKRWFKPFETYSSIRIDNTDNERENELLERINLTREKVITPLNNFHNSLKNSKTVRDMCRTVYDFLLSIGVDSKISSMIDEFNNLGDILLSREYSQVFDILIDILDQTVEIMGDDSMKVSEFVELLSVGFSECCIASVPSVIDSVRVANVDRMRNQSAKVLFILGVNDGVFPAPIVDEGIINDIERSEIKLAGLKMDLDTREKSFNEQFLIYSALTSASEKLRLSYPISDHEGKTLRQSIIIHRVKKVFPRIKQESDLIDLKDDDIENITSISPTFNSLVLKIRKYNDTGYIDPLWLDVFRWFKRNEDYSDKINSILEGLLYTNQVKKVPRDKIRQLYSGNRFSVSQLETYSKCPYSYFVKYGLKAKERREYGFKALEIGNFMHRVLEDFSGVIKKEAEDIREIEKDWIQEAVGVIVDNMLEALPQYVLNSSARYKFLSIRLKRLIVNAIWVITEHIKAGEFEAVGYEEGFGPHDRFPPIVIELEDGEVVELVGKIDRLDEATIDGSKYIRIVDYKSSKRKVSLSDIYYGLQMQLLVYLDAILESYEKKDTPVAPGGIFYFKLDEPLLSTDGNITPKEAQEKMLEEFRMEGLLLKDMNLALAMDSSLTSKSKIVPVSIKKDGEFSATSNAVSLEDFNILRSYVKGLISKLCSRMLSGEIEINPYKDKDESPCEWCEYSPICQFDISFKDNSYNITKSISKEAALDKIKEEVEMDGK
ncbi:helicase-exonuclease AddAB subunit AddB [Clostridium cylindrosporum]|uniref:ATP-dependent helicase/deoxyribonuclease subunit B n=1 Tax=Clostridium cylindrosporum DSM 605 TaxID=1121307 RepID=A0A0J8DB94_CLOCY|nr:helicase-exonuclease AddAB subunit AddB [Clostridium cylindrosporum]KMT23345.1 ATP-dependent helicase/deoxyribonuclease subunit B [Clostridium cylindrosporum DSM 605]